MLTALGGLLGAIFIYILWFFNMDESIILFLLQLLFTFLFILSVFRCAKKEFKSIPTLLFYTIFAAAPPLTVWLYIFTGLRVTYFHEYWKEDVVITTVFLSATFFSLFLLSLELSKKLGWIKNTVKKIKFVSYPSRVMSLLLVALIIIFTVLGRGGQTIFEARYGTGIVRSQLGISTISEFVLVFVPLSFIFLPKNRISLKKYERLIFAGIFFSIIYNALFGSRISGLQILIMFLIVFKSENLNLKNFTIFSVVTFILMAFWGSIRGGNYDFMDFMKSLLVLDKTSEFKGLPTISSVYYSFLAAVGITRYGRIDPLWGTYYLGLLPTIFLKTRTAVNLFGEMAKPPSWIIMEVTPIGGGSFFIGTMYMNFGKGAGIIFIILAEFLYSMFFIKSQMILYSRKSEKNLLKLFAIIWAATLPRSLWYGDITFIKIGIWGVITYVIFKFAFLALKPSHNS